MIQQIALKIVEKLKSHNHIAYFAGGFVRDKLLGITSDEIDIATSATPDEIQSLFFKTIPVGISFGVVIVIEEGTQFEISTFRKDIGYQDGRHPSSVEFSDAKEDALRRDFTINGMFYDPLLNVVLDYVGGKDDLKLGVVRAIGNPEERFREDRLRMVRAFRFAARFDFEIEKETLKAIKNYAKDLFPSVSMERISQELTKMSRSPNFLKALIAMGEAGLLTIIFPDYKIPKTFSNFPHGAPLIAFLLELFPHYSLEQKLELCDYLKLSNQDKALVQFFHESDNLFLRTTIERYVWAKFYAHPLSSLYLSKWPDQKALHAERQKELFVHIQRIKENRPLITSTLLQNEGIAPGKLMGFLLKEGEKLVINEDIHNDKVAIQKLKSSPLWPNSV